MSPIHSDVTFLVLAAAVLFLLAAILILVALQFRKRPALAPVVDLSDGLKEVSLVVERVVGDFSDRLLRRVSEVDQGVRSAVTDGIQSGLIKAFEQVQAGMTTQSQALTDFGNALKTDIGMVKSEVGSLAANINAALTAMTALLGERLSAAETAAADGRAALLRDTMDSILKAREDIATTLKGFGNQQGEHLVSIAGIVKAGGEASQTSLGDFRKELGDRLDAVAKASSDLLVQATATFGEIKGAVVDAEQKTATTLSAQHLAVLELMTTGQSAATEKLTKELGDLNNKVREGLDSFAKRLREEQELLRGLVGTKLDEMRCGNEAKLEDMRKAVDEKLQTALEKQIGESFARVAEQFAAVQQAIGQVQQVAGQVGDLKRLFSNVKSRGGWGEAQVEAMLQDMLPEGAYMKNMRMQEATQECVEFAIRIPARGGDDTWLSVDSKFPTEDYSRLLDAHEQGNRDDEDAARLALERRIKQEAERIASKYICPPKTVEFAILYLPSDSLFAEVARSPGLIEQIRRVSKVMVMGPSLFPAFLHTVKVGYLTIALERNVSAIGETLAAVKTEWGKLEPWLAKLADKADSLKKTIDGTQQRARAVGRKLRTVDVIDQARAENILGLDSPAFAQDEQDEHMEEIEQAATVS